MNSWRAVLLLFTLLAGLSATVRSADISSTTLHSQIADWSFIQSVGGLQVGKTLQQAQFGWTVELQCDLSGHETFTQKPTTTDSRMIIQKTLVEAKGNDVFISLVASPVIWTSNPDKAKCKSVSVESTPGFHQIYYRDGAGNTYPLKQVEFNKDSAVLNQNPG